MATPTVELTRINVLAEVLIRAGNTAAPHAQEILQKAYEDADLNYPDAVGISTL